MAERAAGEAAKGEAMPPALHIQHRRRLAWFACRAMPESFAIKFTPGEHAALKIVGDEMNKHGACSLSPFDIAAAACVSKSTVLLALKKAEAIGLVAAEHRRGTAAVVRSLSTAWPASLLAPKEARQWPSARPAKQRRAKL